MRTRIFLTLTFGIVAVAVLVPTPNALPALVPATIHTVGSCGFFEHIQQAIDAAATGDDTEIRVQKDSTYVENLDVPPTFSSGSITLTGGWECSFLSRDDDPSNTTIDGGGAGSTLTVRLDGGSFTIMGFTITNGLAERGGGIHIMPFGDSVTIIEDVRIVGNRAEDTDRAYGGGLTADLNGGERVEVDNVRIRNNQASSPTAVYGGGLYIASNGSSEFLIEDSEIDENTAESALGGIFGPGMDLSVAQTSSGLVVNTNVVDNTAIGDNVPASGAYFKTNGSADLTVERWGMVFNSSTGVSAGPQLTIFSEGESTFRMSDSGIAWGEGGVRATSRDSAVLHLVNLTVADTIAGIDLIQYSGSVLTLYNTIAFGNDSNLTTSGTIDTGSNLIGVDPLFLNSEGLDYHLRSGSPAENAGDNNPPGGLGSTDFDGNPRIKDGVVDIGMFEGIAEIFHDGFESGNTSAWSDTVP